VLLLDSFSSSIFTPFVTWSIYNNCTCTSDLPSSNHLLALIQSPSLNCFLQTIIVLAFIQTFIQLLFQTTFIVVIGKKLGAMGYTKIKPT
jgi:hypothetical protein